MYVRMLVGRYAGQILDVDPVAGRALLARGRGEDPYAPPKPVIEQPPSEDPAVRPVAGKKRDRAKSH